MSAMRKRKPSVAGKDAFCQLKRNIIAPHSGRRKERSVRIRGATPILNLGLGILIFSNGIRVLSMRIRRATAHLEFPEWWVTDGSGRRLYFRHSPVLNHFRFIPDILQIFLMVVTTS